MMCEYLKVAMINLDLMKKEDLRENLTRWLAMRKVAVEKVGIFVGEVVQMFAELIQNLLNCGENLIIRKENRQLVVEQKIAAVEVDYFVRFVLYFALALITILMWRANCSNRSC